MSAPFAVKPIYGRRIHLARAERSPWSGQIRNATLCGLYYADTVAPRVDQPATCATCTRHSLTSEGAAHNAVGERLYQGAREGRALCSCGELSPDLPSTAARRRWHLEHKAARVVTR